MVQPLPRRLYRRRNRREREPIKLAGGVRGRGYFLWIFFLTEGARAEEKGRLVGRASVRALLPDPRATPCTPRMKPNAAARKNGTVAA